jgi:hypothetical protein
MGSRSSVDPLARPHTAVTGPATLSLAHGRCHARCGRRHEQTRTDRLRIRHLATSLVSTSTTNSLSRLDPRPTVHAAPTTPNRHDRVAQRTQSVCRIPAHAALLLHRNARAPARHRTHDALPPLPSTMVHHSDPATHHFACNCSEPARLAAKPASHRRL